MAISVLATKCRFCGESVGRPRVEDRHFTAQDLGGAKPIEHHVPAEMINAIQAFRDQEFAGQAPELENDAELQTCEPTPPLDLGAGSGQAPPPSANAPAPSPGGVPSAGANKRRFVIFLAAVSGVVVAYLAIASAISWSGPADGPSAEPAAPRVNPAQAVLDRDGPGLQALRQAMQALKQDDSPENHMVAERARAKVAKDARALFESDVYNEDRLNEALAMVKAALEADPKNPLLLETLAEVEEELFAYGKMTIKQIDREQDAVTLKLLYPENVLDVQEVEVSPGDTIRDRFVLKNVGTDYIRLEDTKRKDSNGLNRIVKLYMDGSIS